TARRNVDILAGYAQREPEGRRHRIVLRFLTSPLALLGEHHVEGIRICRNELRDEGSGLRACATDTIEEIPCGIVFRSIGYRGIPLEGLPFDEAAGTLPHDGWGLPHGDGSPP